jgi:hypothetical protein
LLIFIYYLAQSSYFLYVSVIAKLTTDKDWNWPNLREDENTTTSVSNENIEGDIGILKINASVCNSIG